MRLVLIRHAHSESNASGVLSGRLPNVHLSEKGRKQAENLATRLGLFPVSEVRVSPMERCEETIQPWLQMHERKDSKPKVITDHAVNEVDYGLWSGKKLISLSRKREWKTVQESPSRMYFPNGEGIAAMQSRAMATVHDLAKLQSSKVGMIISHGDVIKSIVAHCLGMHLDQFQRLVIEPASLTIIDTDSGSSRLVRFNDAKGFLSSEKSTNQSALGGSTGNVTR